MAFSTFLKKAYLVTGTNMLLSVKFTDTSKFNEAYVIKVVLDSKMVTIPKYIPETGRR